jgi:hypothetical protein
LSRAIFNYFRADFTIERMGPVGIDVRYMGTSINPVIHVANFY